MSRDWCIENDFAAQRELAEIERYNSSKAWGGNRALRARIEKLESVLLDVQDDVFIHENNRRHALIAEALKERLK